MLYDKSASDPNTLRLRESLSVIVYSWEAAILFRTALKKSLADKMVHVAMMVPVLYLIGQKRQ